MGSDRILERALGIDTDPEELLRAFLETDDPEGADTFVRASIVDMSEHRRRREEGADPAPSGQLPSKHRDAHSFGKGIVHPPHHPDVLAAWPEHSTILPQCIDALTRNIELHGHTFAPTFDAKVLKAPTGEGVADPDAEFRDKAIEERQRAAWFFEHASLEMSFGELRARTRRDMETVGWSGWEYIRDRRDGSLCGLEHAAGCTLRLGQVSEEPVELVRKILSPDGSEWIVQHAERFVRLYVQVRNGKRAWFKEPGDQRRINRTTGDVVGGEESPEDFSNPELARELLWFNRAYNPRSPYGLPRWIGAGVALAGSRSQELTNLAYFDNKSVPPLAVLVSGLLSKASHQHIAEKVDELKGIKNFHKILILEAVGKAGETAKDLFAPGAVAAPRITIEKLTDAQQGDALFQEYDRRSRDKVRSACGLPPIAVGESQEYTRATAFVSAQVAEQGTYGPARRKMDDRINRFVMSELEILWWRFRSKGPKITNVEDVTKAIEAGVKAGAGSPNVYAEVLEELLGVDVPQIDQPWAQFPIGLVQAALQAGLITIDFQSGTMSVNEAARADFEAGVRGCVEDVVASVVEQARQMQHNGW